MKHRAGTVSVAVILVALPGCRAGAPDAAESPSPTPRTHTLRGELVLFDFLTVLHNQCEEGYGEFSDIRAGTRVTVHDGAGSTLAVGRLGEGLFRRTSQEVEESEGIKDGCHYSFEMEVPESDFYRVEVADRGETEYSLSELQGNDWFIEVVMRKRG